MPSADELRLCRLDFDDFSLGSDDMLLAAVRIFRDSRLINSFNIDYDVCTTIDVLFSNKPVGELARALLSFKRPSHRHRTATVPIIGNFHLGVGLRQILLLLEF